MYRVLSKGKEKLGNEKSLQDRITEFIALML